MIFEIPIKISKLTKITGALNHTYPELSVARATLVYSMIAIYMYFGFYNTSLVDLMPQNIVKPC